MTRTPTDPRTEDALASLDPARDARVDPDRYASTLARILALGPPAPAQPERVGNGAPRRARRRPVGLAVGLAVGLVAVVAASAVVVGVRPAYAGWTPVPTALPPAEADQATRSCLAYEGRPGTAATETLIADHRGRWVYVLARTSAGTETSCVMPEALVGTAPSSTDRRVYAGGSGESLTDPVGARQVDVSTTSGSSTEEGLFMLTEGQVGAEVQGVVVLTPTGKRVTASVHHGRYAAWWPAGRASSRNPELTGALTLQVEMTDGTVVAMRG